MFRRVVAQTAAAARTEASCSGGLSLIACNATDFRGKTQGHEAEIVEGDLGEIDSCDAVLTAFTAPDEGTAMEAWYAHSQGKRVVAYTGGTPPHPWTVYVADAIYAELERAVQALADESHAGE
jgi:nucleoside 2-deoxyribosyltransferase